MTAMLGVLLFGIGTVLGAIIMAALQAADAADAEFYGDDGDGAQ